MKNALSPMFAAAVLATSWTTSIARAAGTKIWEVRTAAGFAEGKLDGVIVTSPGSGAGELRTGWRLEKIKVEADAVWCLLPDGEGGTFVGTGNKGLLYRLKGKEIEKVAETKAVAVTVLRRGPDGGVLVGTAPDARILVLKDGELKELVRLGERPTAAPDAEAKPGEAEKAGEAGPEPKPDEGEKAGEAKPGEGDKGGETKTPEPPKYIWDLAVAPDGTIYAATGPEGGLYRINGDKAELWFKSKEPNLISLALGDDDVVYAGSGEKGLLFRVTGKDKASVAYDFNENEVRAILVREDGLVIAANSAKSRGGGSSAPSAPPSAPAAPGGSGGAEVKTGLVAVEQTPPGPSMPSKEPMDCAVYRLGPDGAVEPVFSSKGEFIWNVVPLADGSILAGTGENGRVYRLRMPSGAGGEAGRANGPVMEDGGADVLFDLEEGQALALGAAFGKLEFIGTGNGAALCRTDAAVPGKGRYESKVLDATFVASWGRLEWKGKGDVEIMTRSGATAEPDETWHEWTPLDAGKPVIASPRARYLQFSATLKGRDSVLKSVRAAYLPDNQRPHIQSVAVDGGGNGAPAQGGEGGPPAAPSPAPAQASGHSTARTVAWKASDPDGDALKFTLSFKLEGDPDDFFRAMNPRGESGFNEPVTGDKFTWETRGLPDGRYVVRVVASDEGANPEARSRSAARHSEPALIDHTAPEISDVTVEQGVITGTARDAASRITFLAWSLDGGKLKALAPEDGIFDSQEEGLKAKLPEPLAKGPHAAAVQAADEAGNLETVRVTFRVE
jgi:hypothetical protein